MPLYATSGLLEHVCLARGHEGVRARTHLIALLLMGVTAWLAIPHFGGPGAALALLVGFFYALGYFSHPVTSPLMCKIYG